MATNANWTVVFEDKCIIKNYAEGASEGVAYRMGKPSAAIIAAGIAKVLGVKYAYKS